MNVFNTIKIMGILLLATVALTACNKQEGKVAARDCSTWQYQLASCSKEEMKESAYRPKRVEGVYKFSRSNKNLTQFSIYYPDGVLLEAKSIAGSMLYLAVGMYQQSNSQIDYRLTGGGVVSNEKATAVDFKPMNLEITELIQMDADGSFATKRVRTISNGMPEPEMNSQNWSTSRMIPEKDSEQLSKNLRQLIPAQFLP